MSQEARESPQRAGLDTPTGSLETSMPGTLPPSAIKAEPPSESQDSDSALRIPGLSPIDRSGVGSRVWSWIKKDTKSTDWLIVLLTTVIAGTSYFQWREIHSGATQIQDQQRAWVGMSSMKLTPQEVKADSDVVFSVTILNSGRSPALEVVPVLHWHLLGKNEVFPTPDDTPVSDQGLTVIFPSAPQQMNTYPIKFQQAELDAIKGQTAAFRVWGEISYKDVYRRPHWTHFCAFLAPNLKDMFACERYNDTDDKKAE